jgi:hypothetical protein
MFWSVICAIVIWAIWQAVLSREQRADEFAMRRRTWGCVRIFFGLVLLLDLYVSILQLVTGTTPHPFAPSNHDQVTGMVFGYLLVGAAAGWVLWTGVRMVRTPVTTPPIEPTTNTLPAEGR